MTLERLIELGFDRSYESEDGCNKVRCSQCEALCIQGTPTHEAGCPHTRHECFGCEAIVERGVRYCEECA